MLVRSASILNLGVICRPKERRRDARQPAGKHWWFFLRLLSSLFSFKFKKRRKSFL